ncbi:MAG: helix-turn-helix domain-containing protein [Ignavibacteria bacterium]|nr:helix-turn-helix domain-containing protein [Ignavibacteria bacterium]MBK6420463.1 helix-turn-helix domain-containing protein [Ignavibacteria bacterium]
MEKAIESATNAEPLIDIDQAASIVKLKRSTIYALTSKRRIPHYSRGGRLYFDAAELHAWLREGRREVIDSSSAERHLAGRSGGQK